MLGEEACELDASLLGKLKDAPLAFIIDPVDGTYNFATGVPLFGVMLAVVVNGETVAGIIHDPVGKDWIIGVKGAGSHIRSAFNVRQKVSVAPPAAVSEMLGAISWQFLADPLRSTLARNHAKCKASFGFRCAAHEYRLIASGNAHFALFNKLMPWDHLAGVLIHQEAGGHAARFDGSAYLPRHLDGGLLIAPNKANWQDLRAILWSELSAGLNPRIMGMKEFALLGNQNEHQTDHRNNEETHDQRQGCPVIGLADDGADGAAACRSHKPKH